MDPRNYISFWQPGLVFCLQKYFLPLQSLFQQDIWLQRSRQLKDFTGFATRVLWFLMVVMKYTVQRWEYEWCKNYFPSSPWFITISHLSFMPRHPNAIHTAVLTEVDPRTALGHAYILTLRPIRPVIHFDSESHNEVAMWTKSATA